MDLWLERAKLASQIKPDVSSRDLQMYTHYATHSFDLYPLQKDGQIKRLYIHVQLSFVCAFHTLVFLLFDCNCREALMVVSEAVIGSLADIIIRSGERDRALGGPGHAHYSRGADRDKIPVSTRLLILSTDS